MKRWLLLQGLCHGVMAPTQQHKLMFVEKTVIKIMNLAERNTQPVWFAELKRDVLQHKALLKGQCPAMGD